MLHTIRINLLCIAVFACCFTQALAQKQCSKNDLLGEWKEVASLRGQWNNIDSIKSAVVTSKRSLGTWQFNDNNTYKYRHPLQRSRYRRNSVFTLDEKSCEILLGKRRDAHLTRNLEVIFLDEKHLIYQSDNNPKGYFTHVLVRKTDEKD